ncbi:peptide deformylase [Hypnocyclicus thermotrophus]|uniref:Peptide deformylase n=1 Tax=Hypnocyclicus thermotrophus TaxID=1627895 RepID=A0AA46I545_9FUSO|nr:peptide deformylase [Hypnocyclicus thermotrophus]TDT68617.1 peptide deformylase [Hypnocyclicus thermotrophus]
MIMDIVTYGSSVLREKSKKIEKIDDEIKTLLNNMVETMQEAQGVGLAAPQVGINIRAFVLDIGDGNIRKVINPEFLEFSNNIVEQEEGCLSIPGIYKKVKRPESLKIKYLNENGEEVIEQAEGLLARAFQHEYDHLEGVLFVDKISPVAKRLVSNKLQKLKKETLKKIK